MIATPGRTGRALALIFVAAFIFRVVIVEQAAYLAKSILQIAPCALERLDESITDLWRQILNDLNPVLKERSEITRQIFPCLADIGSATGGQGVINE